MRKVLLLVVFSLLSVALPAQAQFCPGAAPWVFDDVPDTDPFCGYITWAAQNGITLGCGVIDANHRLYCPSAPVLRSQMAAFVNRLGNVRVEAVGTGPGLTGGPITSTGTINLAATNLLPTTACAAGQVPQWSGSAWACANVGGGGTVTSVGSGTGLTGGPIATSGTLSIATGYQLPQGCANGQVAKSNGSNTWTCANDNNAGGTVTSVATGLGLTGGPITASGTINLAATQLLPTVACANGQVPTWATSAWSCATPGSFIGSISLPNSTASVGNVTKPGGVFLHNFGSNNTFAGVNAGNLTMTGVSNAGFGTEALENNTTANNNAAFGAFTLQVNTVGATNLAAGAFALNTNTTGSNNAATGAFSLRFNTTGNANTAVGAFALNNNTTASANTAVGRSALGANTTGGLNTGVGAQALTANTTGLGNAAVGQGALSSNTTGQFNAAFGTQALFLSTTADSNTATGVSAMEQNTTGAENTANGQGALSINTTGSSNVAIGLSTLLANTTGSLNTALGYKADAAGGNLTNATAIGANAIVDASNHVRVGDANVTQIGGQVAWTNLSDRREKKDVRDISLGLDFVMSLRPVEYRMRNGNDRVDLGFIAQEVEALLGTGYNVLGIGATAERKLSLRYTDLIAPMAKAIQQQQSTIASQQAQIDELRRAVEVLMARGSAEGRVASK